MKQYHIALSEEHSAKYAIIPGDPGRVEKIAAFLDDAKQVGNNREYNSYLFYSRVSMAVCSFCYIYTSDHLQASWKY